MACLLVSVSGFSSGAGACTKGVAAVGTSTTGLNHLDYGPDSESKREGGNGTLSGGATILTIDGIPFVPGTTVDLEVDKDLVWSVQAFQVAFRGLLVRVEAEVGTDFTLGFDAGLQEAAVCNSETGNVVGVTHTNSMDKEISTGTMRFDAIGPVTIDVTAVYFNGNANLVFPNNTSLFAYSGFTANVVAAAAAPTAAPVSPPVEPPIAPVTPPTPAPMIAPPVTPPVAPTTPTAAPVAPVSPPVLPPLAPTVAPVPTAPVAPPVLPPIAPPAPPVAPPVLPPFAPVNPPTDAPTASPTPIPAVGGKKGGGGMDKKQMGAMTPKEKGGMKKDKGGMNKEKGGMNKEKGDGEMMMMMKGNKYVRFLR